LRFNVVDERDLTEAAERLASFLTDAASAPPTIVSLAAARPVPSGSERLQKTPKGGEHGQSGASAVAPAGPTAVSS
jgi:hypothetical protein